jgi:hypothetical protein
MDIAVLATVPGLVALFVILIADAAAGLIRRIGIGISRGAARAAGRLGYGILALSSCRAPA